MDCGAVRRKFGRRLDQYRSSGLVASSTLQDLGCRNQILDVIGGNADRSQPCIDSTCIGRQRQGLFAGRIFHAAAGLEAQMCDEFAQVR